MKKHSQNTTVYRIELEKGNYTTISRSILISKELTDSAKTLLQLCLNNTSEWNLALSHYKKLLSWSNDKMSGAVSNLIENGYLKKEKLPNGKGKGFTYIYTVSEFGNLNPNREKATQDEINESLESFNNENEIQALLIEQDDSLDTEVASTKELTDEDKEIIFAMLTEAITGHKTSNDYLETLVGFYLNEFESGKLDINNFNREIEISKITRSIEKSKNAKLKIIEEWIDFHNNRGTKDQRTNIKEQALRYFKELDSPLDEVEENHVSNKILKLKMSIVDANRIMDRKYQD